jgi:gas vesicle protein
MQKVANFLVGMIAGALLGSALALLLAPASGNQVRADIQNYTNQVRSEVELAAQTKRTELETQLAKLRGEIVSE